MITGVLTNSRHGATTLGMIDTNAAEMTVVTIDEMSDGLSPVRKGGTTDVRIDETTGSTDAISPAIINRTTWLIMVTIVAAPSMNQLWRLELTVPETLLDCPLE